MIFRGNAFSRDDGSTKSPQFPVYRTFPASWTRAINARGTTTRMSLNLAKYKEYCYGSRSVTGIKRSGAIGSWRFTSTRITIFTIAKYRSGPINATCSGKVNETEPFVSAIDRSARSRSSPSVFSPIGLEESVHVEDNVHGSLGDRSCVYTYVRAIAADEDTRVRSGRPT